MQIEGLSSHHPVDEVRQTANQELDPKRKSALGQFMTPLPVAHFMAGLFRRWDLPQIRLLDAGAGVGSLTAAFLDCWLSKELVGAKAVATAYEIDDALCRHLKKILNAYCDVAQQHGMELQTNVIEKDFIKQGTEHLLPITFNQSMKFTHAILNPPYKKINSSSDHRLFLREVGIETVNLYTGFLAVSLALLEPGGELVAIVPRSFCNGAYYRPFREWMRKRSALTHLHLFESRRKAFKHDEVLQENIIARWVRDERQSDVIVSWCEDATFAGLERRSHPFASIVRPDDPEGYIHIPVDVAGTDTQSVGLAKSRLFSSTLKELGLEISTGPVVDFRLRTHLSREPKPGAAALLYPQHFVYGELKWPSPGRKPNAILINHETDRWLFPLGRYVVTKRFTSKEEARRVVAHVVEPKGLPGKRLGLENHLNVFHAKRDGLDADLAHGLALFLNSTLVDRHFRIFSGHTQVNATDLRLMRYPTLETLVVFGKWAQSQPKMDKAAIDVFVERHA